MRTQLAVQALDFDQVSIGSFALRFYMQDVLGLDGATMGRLKTAGSLPWNLKPLIGMISAA